ncbi:MAG: hypothetical protein IJ639_00350 [Ruminococcus sp.]|nr:hypothetical protein [Ruminococcus sp.]
MMTALTIGDDEVTMGFFGENPSKTAWISRFQATVDDVDDVFAFCG